MIVKQSGRRAIAVRATGEATIAANATPGTGRLEGLLGYALRRAQLRVFADFARAMDGGGPTPGQLGALLLVAANPGLTQTALGKALGIERSSVVPLVDRLAAKGWLRREAHADRRARALRLAPGGEQLLARLRPLLDAHEKRIARGLRPAERRQLMGLLARVAPAA